MDFNRPARSQPERTRQEDRRLKLNGLRDNLEAIVLLALVDGLTDQLLYPSGGVTPDDAVAALDAHLRGLFDRGPRRARSDGPSAAP